MTKEGVTGEDATTQVLSEDVAEVVSSALAPDIFKLQSIRTRVVSSLSNGSTRLQNTKLLIILFRILTPLSQSLNRE